MGEPQLRVESVPGGGKENRELRDRRAARLDDSRRGRRAGGRRLHAGRDRQGIPRARAARRHATRPAPGGIAGRGGAAAGAALRGRSAGRGRGSRHPGLVDRGPASAQCRPRAERGARQRGHAGRGARCRDRGGGRAARGLGQPDRVLQRDGARRALPARARGSPECPHRGAGGDGSRTARGMSDSMRTPSATPARAPIPRAPLRAEVRRALIETLTRGDPPPGTPLSEPALAAGLGISRTPLREALLGLAHEGLLETTPGRGLSVAPLTSREVEEIYPMLWTLEGLALRSGPLPDDHALDALERLNESLGRAQEDAEVALETDRAW